MKDEGIMDAVEGTHIWEYRQSVEEAATEHEVTEEGSRLTPPKSPPDLGPGADQPPRRAHWNGTMER